MAIPTSPRPEMPPNGQLSDEGRTPARRAALRIRRQLVGPASVYDLLPRGSDLPQLRSYRAQTARYWQLYQGGWTMLSARRARALARAAATVVDEGIEGDLVDCGVWNGGSTIMLASFAPGRRAWAFDSFEGLPEPGELDGEDSRRYVGDCLGAEQALREGFRRFCDPSMLNVRAGWFQDTFPDAREEIGAISVLHCDGDWYDSVRLTLEAFYDKVSPGGFVVVDDYGHWIGAKRATDEFRARVGDTAPLVAADDTGRYWRKPADLRYS